MRGLCTVALHHLACPFGVNFVMHYGWILHCLAEQVPHALAIARGLAADAGAKPRPKHLR